MDKSVKIRTTLLVLLVVLTTMSVAPAVYTTETNAQETALSLLGDVIQLDLARYETKLESYIVKYADETTQEHITYTLNSQESDLKIYFKLKNNVLIYLAMSSNRGTPIFATEATTVADRTRNFLENYKDHTNDPELSEMIRIFNTVDISRNSTTTIGNIKLIVTITKEYIVFNWFSTFSGADYPGLSLGYIGNDMSFVDDRPEYEIGNTEVTITKEEAIATALKHMESYSLQVGITGEILEVNDLIIAENKISAKLLTWPRKNSILYPCWNVELGLDKLYPGNVYAISVYIWADNGEVFKTIPLGFGGPLPSNNNTTDQTTHIDNNPEIIPSNNNTTEQTTHIGDGSEISLNMILVMVSTAIIVLCAITIIAVRRGTNKFSSSPPFLVFF